MHKICSCKFRRGSGSIFCQKMITTQKMRMEEERSRAEFFETVEGCLTECAGPDSVVVFWLREMYSKKKFGYQTVIREYGRDRERTEKLLKTVGRALILLEDIRETEEEYPLAVFSAEISGNPHYFDQGTTAGQLLVHGMCYATRTDYPEMPIGGENYYYPTVLCRIIFPLSCISMDCDYRLTVTGTWRTMPFAGGRSPVRLPWKICRS